MRCRLILLISEHPIQQGIRKGGGPYFRSRTRTERTDRMEVDRSCLCVCVSVSKSHYFCIQRIWSFLMFIDTFRIQKCLETVKRQNPLKYSKNLVNSPVSRHFLYMCVTKMLTFRIQKIWLFLTFIATFRTQRNWSFPCFLTLL